MSALTLNASLAWEAMSAPALDGAVDSPTPEAQLEAAVGGADALQALLATGRTEEIRETLSLFGIGYVDHAATDSFAATPMTSCPQLFDKSLRNTWHVFDGEFYFVDTQGRPAQAYKFLPTSETAKRNKDCQHDVGVWGDKEDPAHDYDGGHMIGAQFGGWQGRLNLVPQEERFNEALWRRIEGRVARCVKKIDDRLEYRVAVAYPTVLKKGRVPLVPVTFSMTLQSSKSGAVVSMHFDNVADGGAGSAGEVKKGFDFLESLGCAPPPVKTKPHRGHHRRRRAHAEMQVEPSTAHLRDSSFARADHALSDEPVS